MESGAVVVGRGTDCGANTGIPKVEIVFVGEAETDR